MFDAEETRVFLSGIMPWRAALSTTVKELRFILNPRVPQSDSCRCQCGRPAAPPPQAQKRDLARRENA